jgi:predicted dehydrogenase
VTSAEPLRIGLLGAARIAPKALIAPARELGIEVAAVAARDPARAAAFAEMHDIARVHTGYADLIADDELDAVYVALPIALHARWTIAALEAGRHVLCEKALALDAEEAAGMVAAADTAERVLMEAMHWLHHPVAGRMLELTAAVGDVHYAHARFDAPISPPDIRYDLAMGGGATMDLGCYPVHFLRTVLGVEPEVVWAGAESGPEQIDVSMTAVLRFGGVDAVMRCSMRPGVAQGRGVDARLAIHGERGWFVVRNPQAPQWGCRIDGELDGATISEFTDASSLTYPYQLRAFADAIAGRRPARGGGTDSVDNMKVLDNIYRSAGLAPRGGRA